MDETEFARAERYMHETWRLEKENAKLRAEYDELRNRYDELRLKTDKPCPKCDEGYVSAFGDCSDCSYSE
jgi:predicted nuclease with TOPRIM domain